MERSWSSGKHPLPVSVVVTGMWPYSASSRSSSEASADDDPAAGIDDRALGGGDDPGGLPDLLGMALGGGLVAGQLHGRQLVRVEVDLFLGDVHRDVDEHRAGTPRAGDVEGLRMMRGQVLGRVLHQVAVLDDGQGDAGDVGLLEGVEPDEVAAHLAGDGHHGHAVHVGVGDGGHQVGGSRTGGGQADPHLARRSGVAVGGVARALLVPHQDVVDVEIVEGVVQGDDLPPGEAEYGVDPFALERFEDHSCCFHAVLRSLR